MPKFSVSAPATCTMVCIVEADDAEAAKKAIWNFDFGLKVMPEDDDARNAEIELEDFEMHTSVDTGNVRQHRIGEIEAEEIDD